MSRLVYTSHMAISIPSKNFFIHSKNTNRKNITVKYHMKLTLINATTGEEIIGHFGEVTSTLISETGHIMAPISLIKMIRSMFPGLTLKESKEFTDRFQYFLTKEFKMMDNEETIKERIKNMMDSLNLEELHDLEKVVTFLKDETPHREDFAQYIKEKNNS